VRKIIIVILAHDGHPENTLSASGGTVRIIAGTKKPGQACTWPG
jgi:hypothetical protein